MGFCALLCGLNREYLKLAIAAVKRNAYDQAFLYNLKTEGGNLNSSI